MSSYTWTVLLSVRLKEAEVAHHTNVVIKAITGYGDAEYDEQHRDPQAEMRGARRKELGGAEARCVQPKRRADVGEERPLVRKGVPVVRLCLARLEATARRFDLRWHSGLSLGADVGDRIELFTRARSEGGRQRLRLEEDD
jgi:hypothetical protein